MKTTRKPRPLREIKEKVFIDDWNKEINDKQLKLINKFGHGDIRIFEQLPAISILYLHESESKKSYKYDNFFYNSFGDYLDGMESDCLLKLKVISFDGQTMKCIFWDNHHKRIWSHDFDGTYWKIQGNELYYKFKKENNNE